MPGIDGTTKGTIIHEVLRGRDAATVLREYGEYSAEHVRQCEEIRSAFLNSDLMKRVKRSFCEVPFVVTMEGRVVEGKIDRLCELDDGSWIVIDYKTEASGDYAALAKEYAGSMAAYEAAARGLVGDSNIARYLYFCEVEGFSQIDV